MSNHRLPLRPLLVFAAVVFALVFRGAAARAALTAEEIESLVDVHNHERCHVDPAADTMPPLAWDPLLASVAQSYADQCVFAHNSNRSIDYASVGGSGFVGENIAWGIHSGSKELALLWAEERALFVYEPFSTSSFPFGHYTQMVWANTTKLGCGLAVCGSTRLLVCDYSAAGNFGGQYPYALGSGQTQVCPEPGLGLMLASGVLMLPLVRRRARVGARS